MKQNTERGPLVPVRVVSVESTEVQKTTSQPASIHADAVAHIRAKVSGYVQTLGVDMGDYVTAGQTLLTLSVPELEKQRDVLHARLMRSEAQEAKAQAGIELAAANVNSAKAKKRQAAAQVASFQAMLAAAEAEQNRTEDLVQRQSLQQRMLDEAIMKRDSAKAQLDASESAIVSADSEIVVAEAMLAAAGAEMVAAQADTRVAQKEIEELVVAINYATLKAPFDGVVTERQVDLGDLVEATSQSSSSPSLFVIQKIDVLRVRIPVPEVDAAMVDVGDLVTLTFPSFTGESVTAAITRVAGSLDPGTRTMMVEAVIENPEKKFLPGMFGQATIALSSPVATNMLPARAIRFDAQGGAFIYVVENDDTVDVVSIQTGYDDGRSIEVVSGVDTGARVVDANLDRLVSGQRVRLLAD